MKKIFGFIMVLTAIGLIAGGGLFAQELKFDGYVNSGLGLVITDQTETAKYPYITAFGVDSNQYGYRFRLNGAYTNEAGNAGAKFRFQSQARSDIFFTIPYAFLWTKFADNVVTLSGGLVDDSTWTTAGFVLADDQGEGLGALAKVTPISGLDIGAGAYVISIGTGDANQNLLSSLANNRIDWYNAKYVFNLGYTLPDTVKFLATYRTVNRSNGSGQSSRAIVSIDLRAVENLTAVLEVEADNLQDFKALKNGEKDAWYNTLDSTTSGSKTPIGSSGKVNFFETLGYKIDSLGFGLNAVQYISLASDTDPGLVFNPWVSYTLGSVVPRLDVIYFTGGNSALNTTGNSNGKYHRTGWNVVYDKDYTLLSFRPSAKFNLDPKTFIELGDLINIEKVAEGTGTTSRITNVFYVDFKLAF
ncbi:hypothetical protein [Leadbettera azotonutricia]|uniref:Porin n=1 Tax=Leadbettera azotonutricia (strain ATCC BAA-888 / DSM 13862 / ZAS-9) TaxID=545695 RepID=F5Y814_LEAAZ|nr:hypothetical protein [Leadbettera azotonutricia]AEF80059.1 hypothetical protein TREAZ_2292 [Leadbettera azotonutricia ZAS-9]